MLIKDNILVEKLTHKTKNISINIALFFNLNETTVELSFNYIPDKFKFKQESIADYLRELTKSEKFDLENISAKIVEDLYDMAVPKHLELTLKQQINSITTSITTSKNQPKFKL